MGGTMSAGLEVEYLPLADLVPYERNSKLHTDEQIDEIAASIKRFGNCDPIGIWHDPDGRPVIVEGHGRALALAKLGASAAPTISLDHLSDEDRRAYSHVHNQTTLNSGLDESVLAVDMADLPRYDWEALGFPVPSEEELGAAMDTPRYRSVALSMTEEQHALFTRVMGDMDNPGGGGNPNANKVCEVLRQWAAR